MKIAIQGTLIAVAILFSYLIYNSIDSKIEFRKEADSREKKVIKQLKDIRKAQISFKQVRGTYTNSYDSLFAHIENDSMVVVKAIGSVPDTLTELQALEQGIIVRDTALIPVKDTLFVAGFPLDSLRFIHFSEGEEFKLQSGELEKNKLKVQVFEAFAPFSAIYNKMDLSNESIDLSEGLRVGSMTDANTSGNWE